VLRKDVIIDQVQVAESVLYGADAILLIARILGEEQLRSLFEMSKDLGLCALVEVHDEVDLERALNCGAELIGINNRDLDTFEVNLNTTIRLAPLVPEHCTVVSESGINKAEEVKRLFDAGVNAVLVGTSIMKAGDVAAKVKELVTAGGQKGGEG
jgi:indole-3-glycerol phosphate synthase